MKRFVGGLREALESPMSLVHNPALLTGQPKAAVGTEGGLVLAGGLHASLALWKGVGQPQSGMCRCSLSGLALHQGLSPSLLMP